MVCVNTLTEFFSYICESNFLISSLCLGASVDICFSEFNPVLMFCSILRLPFADMPNSCIPYI